MSTGQSFKLFFFKAAIITLSLVALFLVVGNLKVLIKPEDPRKLLFSVEDYSSYRYAIIGDSVLCSYYSGSLESTIWGEFEKLSGEKCLPGALNGASILDLVDASEFLSHRLTAGSTVFIGIIPTRFIGKGIVRQKNYFYDFSLADTNSNDSPVKQSVDNLMGVLFGDVYLYNNPHAFELSLKGGKNQASYPIKDYSWRSREDWANSRFDAFANSLINNKKVDIHIDTVALGKIISNLKTNNIKPVFLLTPLNSGLIDAHPASDRNALVLQKLELARQQLIDYLAENSVSYVDLFSTLETDCFTDLVHVNSCGDRQIAAALADAIKKN